MDVDLVTRALPELSFSGGNKRLWMVSELNVEMTHPDTKVVKTMNPDGSAIGYTDGVPEFSGDMKVAVEAGEPEVDYEELFRTRERCLFTYTEAGAEGTSGKRKALTGWRVTSVSKPFSQNGEFMKSVKFVALGHRPE